MTIQDAAAHLIEFGSTITGSRFVFAGSITLYTIQHADGTEVEMTAAELESHCLGN